MTIKFTKNMIRGKAKIFCFIVLVLSAHLGMGQELDSGKGSFYISLGAAFNHDFQKLNQHPIFKSNGYSIHPSVRIAAGYTFLNKMGMEISYLPVEHYYGWKSTIEGLSYSKNRRLFLSHVFTYNLTNQIDIVKNKLRIIPKIGFGFHFWKEPTGGEDLIGNIGQYVVRERSDPSGGNNGLLLEGGLLLEYDVSKSLIFYGGSTFYKGFTRQYNIYLSSSENNSEFIQGSVDGSILSFELGIKYQFLN